MRTATGLHPDCLRRLGHAVERAKDFTMEERQQAAQDGAALPDGSFPIRNSKDLKNAIDDSGRAGHPSAAREHITRRAKALGLTQELPQPWRDHGYVD